MANDFSGDASFISVYDLEPGALGTDAIGANTMVANNSLPDEETVDFKQGIGCGKFVRAVPDGLSRSTINMTGAPFQDNSSRVGTFFAWFQPQILDGTNMAIIARYSGLSTQRAFMLRINTSNQMDLVTAYNNGNSVEIFTITAQALTVDKWAHVAGSYDVADNSYHMRLWNENDDTVYDISGTTANTMDINLIGSYSLGGLGNTVDPFGGLIDEPGFVDRVLTSEEIDRIRAGTFPFGTPAGGNALFLGSNF